MNETKGLSQRCGSFFDKCFIEVTVNIDDNLLAPVYRKLWEDVYIKISNSITKFNEAHELVVGITLSEAIGFIYKATPPRFQKSIPDSHRCVDDVIKSVQTAHCTGFNTGFVKNGTVFFFKGVSKISSQSTTDTNCSKSFTQV